jgi:short-subunit dehydrogenase
MSAALSKVVIVGASSGIGEAMARQLVAEGARVAIVARRQGELQRIAADAPGKLEAYVHDALNVDEVPELFERIERDLGGIDTLIYAAGVMPKIEESEYSFEKDRAMVGVNLLGAMAWMNQAARRFEVARAGTIVGISSIAGERGRRGNPAYCATKAALSTYLESLRNRCSRYGVNVVTIKPGFVDTAMTRGMKGLFWLISADKAAQMSLSLARAGTSRAAFVPSRWALVAYVVRNIPSFIFRKLNF